MKQGSIVKKLTKIIKNLEIFKKILLFNYFINKKNNRLFVDSPDYRNIF